MTNALIEKLKAFADLSIADLEWLTAASKDQAQVGANIDLISEGDVPNEVFLILEGFAYRYKTTPEGRRQIFAYLVPGIFATCTSLSSRRWITPLRPCQRANW